MKTRMKNSCCILMVFCAAQLFAGDTAKGRYLRVELPGNDRYLSLVEAEVFSGGKNIAPKGTASQSTTAYNGPAGLAIDGDTSRKFTHTAKSANPWWEVDLGSEKEISQVVLWNRNGFGERLDNFKVRLLDAQRREAWVAQGGKAGLKMEMAIKDYPAGSGNIVKCSIPAKVPKPAAKKKKKKKAPEQVETIKLEDLTTGFQSAAAKRLLNAGVRELVFIKRFTLNANHVYTEYVNSKWMPGGNIYILDLETGKERELIPSLTGGVFNRFDVSYDAKKVLFDYKKADAEGYRIYEVNIDGTGLRQVTFPQADEQELTEKYGSKGYHHGTDDLHPCYLPDGGITFVSTRSQYSTLCNSPDVFTTKNLYRMDYDGKNMVPLSNSAVSEACPTMMPDGRILYHRWEYVDKTAGNLKCLWAMKPDGTASGEVYGNTISHPEGMFYPRMMPGSDNRICMLGTTHCCPNNAMGTIIVVDTRKPLRSYEAMTFITKDINALSHNGFHFKNEKGEWYQDKTGIPGRLFKDPYPISEQLFVAAHKPKGLQWANPLGYDLSLVDGTGADTLLFRDPAISCWHPFPLVPRKRPPVVSSPLDPQLAAKNQAHCVVTDVYEGMDNVERGTVKYIRIMEQVSRPWAARTAWFRDDKDGMAHTAVGLGLLGLKVQYGLVPVEEDGSAYFAVPAERNIYFQALDKNHMAVQSERTYVNYMPGEIRSCVGCHELPNTVPSSSGHGAVKALSRKPSVMQPQPGEKTAQKVFDYPRQIQPIFDKHCIGCHGGEEPKAGLNLTGAPDGTYSISYNSLIRRPKGKPDLLGNRKLLDENVGSAPIEYLPPYSFGSHTSILLGIHAKGRFHLRDAEAAAYAAERAPKHRKVKLSDEEFARIANWVDSNCQFHPSYWGRKNAKFADHPNFRPEVTLADAIKRVVPETIAAAEAQ
ncbi:MAG: discoidin domain-containing protein [Kiritimatiellales bacterium]|nr:discoidin domain-containing protein [Kiritimatiellales bacterium]